MVGNYHFYEDEFLLYGEIIQQGGVDPTIILKTKEFGALTVKTTKEQLLKNQNSLYKQWGLVVRGKRKLPSCEPYDIELIDFFGEYNPIFDLNLLENAMQNVQSDMAKIENIDAFIACIREKYL